MRDDDRAGDSAATGPAATAADAPRVDASSPDREPRVPPLTEDELKELERDLDARRRCFAPHAPIPFELYTRDVSRLLAATRAQRERLRALVIKARVTAEASVVRANETSDAELRGRLLGQARACSHLAERIEWIVGM